MPWNDCVWWMPNNNRLPFMYKTHLLKKKVHITAVQDTSAKIFEADVASGIVF